MALKATIYKAAVNIADMNRAYYADHELTIARHPSENDERAMFRVLAWCLHADEQLQFTRGISTDDEPDIWQKNLSGEIDTWIELGQPDEKRLRKACGRARKVFIYNYGGRNTDIWWQQNQQKVQRFNNLTILQIPAQASDLATMVSKTMKLHCVIQDQQITMGNELVSVTLDITQRFPS